MDDDHPTPEDAGLVTRVLATSSEARLHRRRWLAGLGRAVVLSGAAGWAGGYLMRPVTGSFHELDAASVVVERGSVGASLHLTTVAAWRPTHPVENSATGVVTQVIADGTGLTDQGDILYSTNLHPVAVARGSVPAFRSIGAGARGEDVAQLQRLLSHLGLFAGAADGRATSATTTAMRAWQRQLGTEVTGVVALGDLVFVPELPARITLDPAVVSVGRRLSGSETVGSVLEAFPHFALPVTASQAALIPAGTEVLVAAPDGGQWRAVTGDPVPGDAADVFSIPLTAVDGGPVCRDACAQIAARGERRLQSDAITMPEREGLVVPGAAIVSDATGEPAVIDETGSVVPVRVIASARGQSIIEGVGEGSRVRVQRA